MNQYALFKEMLVQSSSMVLATGPDDCFVYVSPSMCDAIGKHGEDLTGKTWEETGLPAGFVQMMSANMRLAKDGKVPTTVGIDPDFFPGSRLFECRISPVLDEDGKTEFLTTTFHDVTSNEEARKVAYYGDMIFRGLQSSIDIDIVAPEVLSDLAAAFTADASAILFRQDGRWYPKYVSGIHGDSADEVLLEERSEVIRTIQRVKDVHILDGNFEGDDQFKRWSEIWGVRSIMAIALHTQGEVFGILALAFRSPSKTVSKFQKAFLKSVSAALSLALNEEGNIWSPAEESSCPERRLELLELGVAVLNGKDGSVRSSNELYDSLIPSTFRGISITKMPQCRFSAEGGDTLPEDILKKVVKEGKPVAHWGLQEVTQSGAVRHWQIAFLPIPSTKKAPDVLNLLIDVTGWDKANKKNARLVRAIQDEQYRVRTLLDSVPVGAYLSDAEGRILEIGRMGPKIWGESRPLPRSIDEYGDYDGFWPDTGERLKTKDWPLAKAVWRGETTVGEVIDYRNFDGKQGTVINSAAPIRNRHGEIIGAVEIDQDITKLKSLERSLEATKAYLEAIINQMPAGVAIAEAPSGRITNCNNELRRMFPAGMEMPSSKEAYARWGLLRMDDMSLLAAEDHPLAVALEEKRTVSGYQTALRRANGESMAILISASPVIGKDGKAVGAVAIFTDISRQKEIEQRLEKQTRELAQFNADLQRFAYVTSNELRESLKSITSYLSLIDKNSS